MNITVVASIKYLEIEGIKDPLVGDFVLTRNPQILNAILHNQEFLKRVGLNTVDSIFSNFNLFYQGKSGDVEFLKGLTDYNQIVHIISKFFKLLTESLWFVKNNNCYLSECFVQFNEIEVFSVNGDSIFTDNQGNIETTSFNLDELSKFLSFVNMSLKLKKISDHHSLETSEFRLKNSTVPNPLHRITYDHDRILRSLLFIPLARASGMPIIKLTFYMAIFEALFSSSKEEIRKTISKRASLFIGGDDFQISDNERMIKKAYDIRSSYIHGDIIKIKPDDIMSLSSLIDNMSRKVLVRIFDENFDRSVFLLSKTKSDLEKFNKYFELLGDNS